MVGLLERIPAYIYIYHMKLEFNLPVLPDSIQDSMPISFNSEPILARSSPQITFSSAGPRTQQVTLRLHRHLFCLENQHISTTTGKYCVRSMDPSTGKIIEVQAVDAADLFIDALTTLSLPKYTDATKSIVPPSLLLRLGNESCIRGVPSGFTKSASGVWLNSGKLADISISFTITEVEPFSAQYTAKTGTLRSISTTLQRGSIWQY